MENGLTKKSKAKKVTKREMEDFVWDLWSAYESFVDDDENGNQSPMSEWGTPWFDRNLEKPDTEASATIDALVTMVSGRFNIVSEVILDLLNSVYHYRECVCYDERELASEVRDWTKKLHRAIGKKGGQEEYDHLRSVVEDVLTRSEKTYDADWDRRDLPSRTSEEFQTNVVPRMGLKEKWETLQIKEIVARAGVPEDECHSLIHWGRIARLDEPEYQASRQEVYERLLQEMKHFVKKS